MIVGIGIDLVDIARFERSLARTPRLLDRLFTPGERPLAPRSLAARYAAKEALIKALGGSDGVHWTEIDVTPEPSGRPRFTLSGSTAAVVAGRGITALHLSMSHDAGLATAYVVAESVGDSVSGATEASDKPAEVGGSGPDALTNARISDRADDGSGV
ncbi:holo-ACP synthase [Microbacterium sp. SLBN-146]|uniref:holo-ACP synthase n=1 Tax=Microbacterium sp. SLBN-146 TaxID=2768457 RepID=UPI00115431D1|nr:holo-[acyl-carrier protein] synthase [Microbacterium sp. SLBN-146]